MVDFSPNEKYLVTWSKESFMSTEGTMHVSFINDSELGNDDLQGYGFKKSPN
jgi:uncharacterized protein with WD repeat